MEPRPRVDHFGRFTLNRDSRQLSCDGKRVLLPERHLGVLLHLTHKSGQCVSRDELMTAGWEEVEVGNDSLRQVITYLRKLFGEHAIRTLPRRGYEWTLQPETRSVAGGAMDALAWPNVNDSPHARLREGRRLLDTLLHDGVARAGQAFADVLASGTPLPTAHAGRAIVMFLLYEATRADVSPDRHLLEQARKHASLAWQLAPDSREAWSAVALTSFAEGDQEAAANAARHAVTGEEVDWPFHVVHAYVTTGRERLEAASKALETAPENPIARWCAATVFLARWALPKARDYLVRGCAVQLQQQHHPDEAGAVRVAGPHLTYGQLLLALGDDTGADAALRCELACEGTRQIYEREACANACYTLAVIAWRAGDLDGARDWLRQALDRLPGHPFARLLQQWIDCGGRANRSGRARRADRAGRQADAAWVRPEGKSDREVMLLAMVRAAELVLEERDEDAAAVVMAALLSCKVPVPGPVWGLGIEPLINVSAHPEVWKAVMTVLHQRAL